MRNMSPKDTPLMSAMDLRAGGASTRRFGPDANCGREKPVYAALQARSPAASEYRKMGQTYLQTSVAPLRDKALSRFQVARANDGAISESCLDLF
jgi:hypothetical protein